MGICQRSISGAVAAILGLSFGVSGCVTTSADVAEPSPTVRAQMPSSPAGAMSPAPFAPGTGAPGAGAPAAPYRTTYTYVPADGAPNATTIGRLPGGPSNGPLAAPMSATLNGPRLTPGAPNGFPNGPNGPIDIDP